MNQAIAHIDISTPIGRRLVKELEKHRKVVRIEYSLPEEIAGQKTYSVDEVFNECYDILNEHYNCDVRKL
jgi:hypothetical protein